MKPIHPMECSKSLTVLQIIQILSHPHCRKTRSTYALYNEISGQLAHAAAQVGWALEPWKKSSAYPLVFYRPEVNTHSFYFQHNYESGLCIQRLWGVSQADTRALIRNLRYIIRSLEHRVVDNLPNHVLKYKRLLTDD